MTQQSSATPQAVSAGEPIFQFQIADLANDVQQLLASLHGLNEAVKLLHLSLKAQAAQTDDADAVEVYRLALQEVYGITIYGDVAANFEALKSYQEALDLFAQFLETTYFPDGTLMVDKYRFFQEVMGQITIYRTKDRHEASGEKGFGFSTGHEIWDMFTVNGQDRQSQMTTNNFIHELFHSFNTFSGMGGQRPGSLFARADIVSVLLNNITEESFDGKVYSVPELLRYQEGVRRQNYGVTIDENGTPIFDPSELLADLGLFSSRGLVTDNDIAGLQEAYQVAIQQALIYHMEPLEYARYLVESPFVPGIGTVRSGFTSRLAPSVSSEQLFNIFSVETKISLLGKNETEDWIYVGFSDPQSVQGTQYAWVHRAGVSGDTTNLPILSEAQTDPTRIRLHDNGTVDD